MTSGNVRGASFIRCLGSCRDSLVRRWFSVEKPALASAACGDAIDVRMASKRGPTQASGTLFCLMLDLTLLTCWTFESVEASVRSMAWRFATCSSVIFSPIVEVGRPVLAGAGRCWWPVLGSVPVESRSGSNRLQCVIEYISTQDWQGRRERKNGARSEKRRREGIQIRSLADAIHANPKLDGGKQIPAADPQHQLQLQLRLQRILQLQ
jgi:hypothetical protein